MDEKEIKLKLGDLTDEQNEQLQNMLQHAQHRRPSTMSNEAGRKVGITILVISGILVLFCLYLLLLGGKATGTCTKSPRSTQHHYDYYTYTVEGKEYWTTFNVTKGKPSHLGKEKTIHYLPAAPSVTYDYNLLMLALISGVFGVGFLVFAGDPNIGGSNKLNNKE